MKPEKEKQIKEMIQEIKTLEKDPVIIRKNFIENVNNDKNLRVAIFEYLYWNNKFKHQFRNSKEYMIQQLDEEWRAFNLKDKYAWFDLNFEFEKMLKDKEKTEDLAFIVHLLKTKKLNAYKIYKELKDYSKFKKKNNYLKEVEV